MTAASVLIVDDNEDIRDVLEMALEQEGYVVTQASNGRAALEVVSRGMLCRIELPRPGSGCGE